MKLIDSPPVSTRRSARARARSFDSLTSPIQWITTASTTIQNTRPTPWYTIEAIGVRGTNDSFIWLRKPMGRNRHGSSASSDEAVARGEKVAGWAMPYTRYMAAHASQASTMAPMPPTSLRQPMRIGKCFIAASRAMANSSGGRTFATQATIAPCCSREAMPSGAKLSGTTR